MKPVAFRQPLRLTLFLTLSTAVHLLFLASLPSLTASSGLPLKKPIWVDLVNLDGYQLPRSEAALQTLTPPSENATKSAANKEAGGLPALQKGKDAQREQSRTPVPVDTETKSLTSAKPTNMDLGLYVGTRAERPDEIEYEEYLTEIKRRVENHWQVTLDDEIREGTTVVSAMASADGSLWSVDILEPSGMILHDYEALEAVKQAFPLRPPPKTLLNEKSKLPIRFSFHYLLHSSP